MSIEQSKHSDLIAFDPTLAYFSRIDAEPTLITPENQHLTVCNISTMRQEVVYQGSGDLVDMLHLIKMYPNKREVAFFDTNGEFYNRLILEGLHDHIKTNGRRTIRHNAVFGNNEDGSAIVIPVDNIYCLGGSYSAENDLTKQP